MFGSEAVWRTVGGRDPRLGAMAEIFADAPWTHRNVFLPRGRRKITQKVRPRQGIFGGRDYYETETAVRPLATAIGVILSVPRFPRVSKLQDLWILLPKGSYLKLIAFDKSNLSRG